MHRDVQVSRSTGRARATLAANIPERKAKRRIREQARSYKNSSKPGIVGATLAANPRFVGAALAANIPERKAKRRIREQARSYKNSSKPGIVGAAIAQGCAGAAKHMDVRERPWPRMSQSAESQNLDRLKCNARFVLKPNRDKPYPQCLNENTLQPIEHLDLIRREPPPSCNMRASCVASGSRAKVHQKINLSPFFGPQK